MKKKIILALILSLALSPLVSILTEAEAALNADFDISQLSGEVPVEIHFTDTSTGGPNRWYWDFDSDGEIDATCQNPYHRYLETGSYTVTLTVQIKEDDVVIDEASITKPDPEIPDYIEIIMPSHYTLQVVQPEHGSITPADGNYAPGAKVPLTATADPGYHFTNWSGAEGGFEDTITVRMTENKIVRAVFTTDEVKAVVDTTTTSHYAPLPVFFEGFESTPRDRIVEYLWDFGDGTENDPHGRYAKGFNAAHVYETPRTEPYVATLTVKDAYGNTHTSGSIYIEVEERDGITYYVDSEIGDDEYTGTSDSIGGIDPASGKTIGPWRTATHAFEGMWNQKNRYNSGDQILFKRDRTFEMGHVEISVTPGEGGYLFGAYGEGDKPIIQNIENIPGGNDGSSMLNIAPRFGSYISFVDLEINGKAPDGTKRGFIQICGGEDYKNTLFLRLDILEAYHAILTQGTPEGVFLFDNYVFEALKSTTYCNTNSRYASVGNHFD